MVGKDPSEYRPRRALPADDDDQTAAQPPTPADDHTDAFEAEDDDTAFGIPAYSDSDAEDNPKPLYRDEVTDQGSRASSDPTPGRDPGADVYGRSSSYGGAGSYGGGSPDDADTNIYRGASYGQAEQPAPAQGDDAEDQTRFQRRVDTGVRPSKDRHLDEDVLDDLGDIDDESPKLGQRGRFALLIGAVAAVVILGLAIGYAVIGRPNGTGANPAGPLPSPSAAETNTTGTPTEVNGELLTTEMLVTAADAKPIDADRDWKVSRTVTKVDNTAPQAVCLGASIEGMPTPREAMIQLLESNGKQPPAILHQATAYGTPEEAAQAYALIAKAVGTCTVDGTNAWLFQGRVVTGLGDQSLAVVVKVISGEDEEFRTLVLSRTGRILNVVDVAKQKEAVPVAAAVGTAAAAVNRQCTAAEGACAKRTGDKAGPPPVGDQPGYLSAGDLPAPSASAGAWFADEPQNLTEQQHSSGCETADLSKVAGGRAVSRTFLVDGDAGNFGLDQYMVTLKSEAEAKKLAQTFSDDWEDCRARKVTPTVDDPTKIKGTGAKDAKITGWVTEIKVPTNDSETRTYKVGVAWVGPKLIFTFLSPTDKLDISKGDWKRVTVRAAERATQVN